MKWKLAELQMHWPTSPKSKRFTGGGDDSGDGGGGGWPARVLELICMKI